MIVKRGGSLYCSLALSIYHTRILALVCHTLAVCLYCRHLVLRSWSAGASGSSEALRTPFFIRGVILIKSRSWSTSEHGVGSAEGAPCNSKQSSGVASLFNGAATLRRSAQETRMDACLVPASASDVIILSPSACRTYRMAISRE